MVGLVLAGAACTDDPDPAATETLPASGVTDSLATLDGTVSQPEDGTVAYWFEYGPTADYGSETPERELEIDDRDAQPITEDLAALEPETTIHFRACAEGETTVCGEDESFTTAAASSVTADPALFPAFDPGVTDYVTRCGSEPVGDDGVGSGGHHRCRRGGAGDERRLHRGRPPRTGRELQLRDDDLRAHQRVPRAVPAG